MSNPHYHALSSVRKFKCNYQSALDIHNFFDSSKACYANIQHRSILHNDFGVSVALKIFGDTELNQLICQQHLIEDTSRTPSVDDWWDDYNFRFFKDYNTQEMNHHIVKKFGGEWEDYNEINSFFDSPINYSKHYRYIETLTHNAFGCFLAEQVFGTTFVRKSDGAIRPTRLITEEHCIAQFGRIYSLHEILERMILNKKWQICGSKKLSKELELV